MQEKIKIVAESCVRGRSVAEAPIPRWPRGWRLVLFLSALIVTVVVLVPAVIMGIGYLVGFGACDRPNTDAASSVCTPLGRLLLTALLIAIGLPLGLTWARFLTQTLTSKDTDRRQTIRNNLAPVIPRSQMSPLLKLSLGQMLLSGRIDSSSPTNHHILLDGNVLTFWSLYEFEKGWLKERDQVVLVYQIVPLLKSLKLTLAVWSGPDSPVRGVAAGTQSASMIIAVTCIPILTSLRPPFTGFLLPLAVLLIIIDIVYLLLMIRAKSALRDFINREAES